MPHRFAVALFLSLACGLASAQVRVIPQHSGVDIRLRGISAVDDRVAWGSGREGTVLRTIDGGTHWQVIKVPGASELDFRDVEGFDADTAVVLSIGPGEASRVYRTEDAGRTWRLAFQNDDPEAFLDCMAFDGDRGWILGDPVDGRFQVYRTADAGRSWALAEVDMPPAKTDEAAFAASGSCIAHTPRGNVVAVSGGGATRLFLGMPGEGAPGEGAPGEGALPIGAWSVHETGMPNRIPAAGIFSATAMGAGMLLVGGDFEHEAAAGSAALVRPEDDQGLVVQPLPAPRGYRSGAACTDGEAPVCVAVGPTGVDALIEGGWQPVSDTGYDAIDLAGDTGWASGDDGRIARIEITE